MNGGLEGPRISRLLLLQRGVPICRDEGPLLQVVLAFEGKVERWFVALARHCDASSGVEDGVDLRVLPELVHRNEGVAERNEPTLIGYCITKISFRGLGESNCLRCALLPQPVEQLVTQLG